MIRTSVSSTVDSSTVVSSAATAEAESANFLEEWVAVAVGLDSENEREFMLEKVLGFAKREVWMGLGMWKWVLEGHVEGLKDASQFAWNWRAIVLSQVLQLTQRDERETRERVCVFENFCAYAPFFFFCFTVRATSCFRIRSVGSSEPIRVSFYKFGPNRDGTLIHSDAV